MRVLYCLTSFPAPSQTFVDSQITGLLDRGIDVGIVSLQPAKDAPRHEDTLRYDLGKRTSYVPRSRSQTLLDLSKIGKPLLAHPPTWSRIKTAATRLAKHGPKEAFRLVRRSTALFDQWPFDAIVCHFGPVGADVQRLRSAGVTQAPMATFFHGYDVSRTIDERGVAYYEELFAHGELLLPISDYWRQKLVSLGAPSARTQVHRMGVDCNKIAFRERELAAGQPVQLLSIARLTEKKGIEYALRALARIAASVDFHYHVVGDGDLRGSLERLVDELEMRPRVTMHGWKTQGEIATLLERCQLLLQPSVTASDGDQEGIPVALMEAMAAGMPVVSTEHTGIPELVEHGRSGYLVPERDVAALAARILELSRAPGTWADFGRAGRAMVKRQFDVDVLNDQLAALLEQLVREQNGAPQARMTPPNQPLFETGELKERVAQRAARGALALAVAKPVKAVLTLGSIAALARLLTPADFGLVAMVAVVTRFIDVFRDAGLSTATIQREDLTEAQLSSVFWLNAAISLALGVLLLAAAPAVAWFYDEPRLLAVTAVLALAVLLSGVSIQHRALLRRRMRFTVIVAVELLAFAVSSIVAVAMAFAQPSYWALVMRTLTESLILGVGLWLASGWRPGVPAVAKGVGSIMRFGANLTGFNLLNFLSRNADNLLVGRLFGATALGVYQKAYDTMMLSTKEVMRPAGTVAISALSRLVGEPERYRRAYFRMIDKLMLVSTPFAVLMLATPDWVVDVLLGKQWAAAIPLVRFFGITALLQPMSATVGWLLTTQDRTSGLLRLGVITAAFNLALFALGAWWGGVLGITIVYSVGQVVRTPLSLSYGAREGPVRQRDMYSALLTFTAAGAFAAAVMWAGRKFVPIQNEYIGLFVAGIAACALSWGALALLPRGREALADVPKGVRLLLGRKGRGAKTRRSS